MTAYAHHDFDECVLAEVQIYDLQTGSNWIAKIWDTENEIYRRWMKFEALLAKAGLVLGWHSDGVYRGAAGITARNIPA